MSDDQIRTILAALGVLQVGQARLEEKLMRSVEEQIGVSEVAKKTFREEILIRISSLARRGQTDGVLEPLVRYDVQYRSDLLGTLEEYLATGDSHQSVVTGLSSTACVSYTRSPVDLNSIVAISSPA